MKLLKLVTVLTVFGAIYAALRQQREGTLAPAAPARPRPPTPADDTEPVLGYDGMDLQTLIPWLESAELDRPTLQRIRRYELAHQGRETVLTTVDDLLD